MDSADRTYSTSVEIPEQLLPTLRDAAEERLKRACRNHDEWNDATRAAVLAAARLVETFDLSCLTPRQIADLAGNALEWTPPGVAPTSMDDVGDAFLQLGLARELVKFRDRIRDAARRDGSAGV
jgi:hypothetical protein